MPIAPSLILQASVDRATDRAMDSVLRALGSDRCEIQGTDAEALPAIAEDDTSREVVAHLCGHVAQALRGMDAAPPVWARYHHDAGRIPEVAAGLDIRR